MFKDLNNKKYDLEERTAQFAKDVRDYVKQLPRTLTNTEYAKQVIRSSGSVAANYIEANECLGKKDFGMRIKICRKEAKESRLWLTLAECDNDRTKDKDRLISESSELIKIFSAIWEKSKEVIKN